MSETATQNLRKTKPRKQPRQKRSQAMIERILGATRGLLISDGLSALTTNHVAAGAGISVGSLYQYFPNKQAILSELLEQWLGEIRAEIEEFSASVTGLTANKAPDAFFELIYSDWRESPDNLKFVLEMRSAVKVFPELSELDQSHGLAMAGIIAGALRACGSQESDEGLQRISLYLYGMHNAFEDMLVQYPADSESLYKVHAQVIRSVFDQALLFSEIDGANK